ncbi:MAG TPA: hypothetical protein VMZ11_09960 [Mycobacteriales bacterium]|nr:hypothetical protein [Mycobacteriales bacterium]
MRRAVAVAALLAALAPGLGVVGGTARADAPAGQGWWWVLHRAALPAPPAPPDVGPDDLLLQGGDLLRVVMPATVPQPTALAALRFRTPAGAEVGPLVLQVGTGARAADVRIYPAATAWSAAQAGAIERAPSPDLTRYAPGQLSADGSTLSFPEAGALVGDDGVLSVVLVAGPTDRVVIHHPGPGALAVGAGQPVAPEEPVAGPPVVAPPLQPPLPPAVVGVPLPVDVPPLVPSSGPAPALAPAAPAASAPVAVRRVIADDGRTRLVVLLEALLLLCFFGLLGQGPLGPLGRRLGSAPEAPTERGVGRFRSPREGAPPRL